MQLAASLPVGPSDSPAATIRQTACKTILSRSAICDYSLNCYTGCQHGCCYCYARFMQRFHPHPEPWGQFVDVKVNAVEVLKRQLRRARPGVVFVSSVCDGWQPAERQWRLTRRCCELLLEYGFTLHVLTKSDLVMRDLELFKGRPATVGVTITTLDERLSGLWEPCAASVAGRLTVIEQAGRAGLKTSIMFAPLLPMLSDSERALDDMFGLAAELRVATVRADALNRRPRVWPAVDRLLRDRFPDLHGHYRAIMFDSGTRARYLSELRSRIVRAAQRHGLADRLETCF